MFDIITIGTATRDAFIKSKDFHVDPDHHVFGGKALVMPLGAKLEIPEIYFSTGGGATNTAVAFSRQGFKTACISVVGDDVSGKTVIHDLGKEEITTDYVLTIKKPTAYSILLEPASGERTVLVYRGASRELSSRFIPWSQIKTKWFYISSLAGNLPLLKKIVQFARKNKINIAYNPGGNELKQREALVPLLRSIQIVIANHEEAALITGIPYKNERGIFKKWDEMSPGINVMTDARNGVWVSEGIHIYRAGIYKDRKVIDRTGAGDAFASGFTAGILRQTTRHKLQITSLPPEAIKYAIRLGSANATSKVEGIGAKYGLLTAKEFETQKRWHNFAIDVITI